MKLRKPARMEDVVLPKRKKNLADFILWMSTSNEAFRLVQKWTNITPLFMFAISTWFCWRQGWVEAMVISGFFFAWSAWNLYKKWPLLFIESGASMHMLGGGGKYGHTYEAVKEKEDHWGRIVDDGKDKR